MNKKLHIVSLDIPFPPDYGGMLDVYYKIKSLSAAGISIMLHCFQYGRRQQAAELERYCDKVFYYPRKTGLSGLHATLPYIISSRNDPHLLRNLLTDDAPILFEGLHCLYWHQHPSLNDRHKILRAHNIESAYYQALAAHKSSPLKRLYYYIESARLARYEFLVNKIDDILAISKADQHDLQWQYPNIPIHYLPAFHGIEEVNCLSGSGTYCLFQGNLQVAENVTAVMYLVNEVFTSLNIPLIIAGKNPGVDILALQSSHIRIVENPDDTTMQQLIQHAHIHVLPAFQQTGIKLKLLHALFAGRHCISNDALPQEPLHTQIHFAGDATAFRQKIVELMSVPFTDSDIARRKEIFEAYCNEKNVKILIDLL